MERNSRLGVWGVQGCGKKTLIERILLGAEDITNNSLSLLCQNDQKKFAKDPISKVAVRTFRSDKKIFDLTDIPHEKVLDSITINGLSNLDMLLIIVDVTMGVQDSVLRQAFLANLLKAPRIMICFNKMDLINFDQDKYNRLCQDFRDKFIFTTPTNIDFIPISAYFNENINGLSSKFSWYKEKYLLQHLNEASLGHQKTTLDLRMPIQTCITHDGKTYFGAKLLSGNLEVGQVVYIGKNQTAHQINRLYIGDKSVMRVESGASITFTLNHDVPLEKGEMLYTGKAPIYSHEYEAHLVWLDEKKIEQNKEYVILKNSKKSKIKINLNLKSNSYPHTKKYNESASSQIAQVTIRGEQMLDFDPYDQNKGNGKFIIIDPATNKTVGAGIIDYPEEKSA